jgi:hypothetical protein
MVRFVFGAGIAEAILGDNGHWSCAAVPCLVRPLEIRYGAIREGRAAGRLSVAGASCWLRGTAILGPEF